MSEHFSADLLATYFDGMMRSPDADEIEVHLTSCADCRARLAEMSGARRAVQLLPQPSAPAEVWRRIDQRLRPGRSAPPRAAPRPPRRRGVEPVAAERPAASGPKGGGVSWRMTAVVALLIVLGAVLVASPLGSHIAAAIQPEEVGINYGGFVDGLADPSAMDRFNEDYERRRMPIRTRGALAHVLAGADLLENPPSGLIPRTAYGLKDDGVRAIQVTYVRDRSLTYVFRQPADHPIRFDGYAPRHVEVDGVSCLVIDAGRHRAVAFSSGAERYVVVARRDDAKLPHLVRTLSFRASSRAS